MAVPKRKVSRSRRGMRRSHDALVSVGLVQNNMTGEFHLPHHVTPKGYYKGKCVIKVPSVAVRESDNQ